MPTANDYATTDRDAIGAGTPAPMAACPSPQGALDHPSPGQCALGVPAPVPGHLQPSVGRGHTSYPRFVALGYSQLVEDRLVPDGLEVQVDDPRRPDVLTLLEEHLDFCRSLTPLCHVYALDATQLAGPDVTLFSARSQGIALGIGALKRLGKAHAELKSMHTASNARRRGIGRALLLRLLGYAREQGYRRVSLETGTMDGFAPARRLYESAGFVPCGPFGGYTPGPDSAFYTLVFPRP
jgi:putative acetyltransferase